MSVSDKVESFLDWGFDHPHKATLLCLLAFILFIFFSILTKGVLFLLALIVIVIGVFYFLIYSLFSGDI